MMMANPDLLMGWLMLKHHHDQDVCNAGKDASRNSSPFMVLESCSKADNSMHNIPSQKLVTQEGCLQPTSGSVKVMQAVRSACAVVISHPATGVWRSPLMAPISTMSSNLTKPVTTS